jgi:hypothetical protein
LSHRVEPKIIEIQIYGYHTLLGLNSYVSDDDKSIRSCLKFIRPSGVPLLPLFATIGATAERKIIEILIHDYHVPCWVPIPMFLMTINRLKVVSRLLNYPVCYFLPLLRPLRSPKLSKSNGPIKLSYNGPMLSGSQMALSGFQNTLSGSQMTLYQAPR